MCIDSHIVCHSGDDADNKFRIDAVTGLIETTASPLDRETRAIYELVVSVTDSGTPPRMVHQMVAISLNYVIVMSSVEHGHSHHHCPGCE